MKQKGLVPFLFIIIITLFVGVGYYFYKNFDSLVDLGTEIPNSTSSTNRAFTTWKTYTNRQYKFRIKYPSDWSVYSDDKPIIYLMPHRISSPKLESVSISITLNSPIPKVPIWFNNYAPVKASVYDGASWAMKNLETNEIIFWKNQTSVLAEPKYGLLVNQGVFDQILSTFKFLK